MTLRPQDGNAANGLSGDTLADTRGLEGTSMEPNISVVTYVALSEALNWRIPILSGVRTI